MTDPVDTSQDAVAGLATTLARLAKTPRQDTPNTVDMHLFNLLAEYGAKAAALIASLAKRVEELESNRWPDRTVFGLWDERDELKVRADAAEAQLDETEEALIAANDAVRNERSLRKTAEAQLAAVTAAHGVCKTANSDLARSLAEVTRERDEILGLLDDRTRMHHEAEAEADAAEQALEIAEGHVRDLLAHTAPISEAKIRNRAKEWLLSRRPTA